MSETTLKRKVQVWVFSEDSSGKRSYLALHTQPARGSFWQPITGGVNPGEAVDAAAQREFFEETGLPSQGLFRLGYEFGFESWREGKIVRFEETCFAVRVALGSPIKLDPKEHDAYEWVSGKEALSRIRFPSNRKSLEILMTVITAPDFELSDDEGKPFRLSQEVLKKPVLLAFYPGDFTAVCTKQLCSYRDDFSAFEKMGVRLIGISPDPVSKHVEFRKEHHFPFPLLADPDKTVFRSYGMISRILFGMAGRGIVLVDSNMQIIYRSAEFIPVTYKKTSTLVQDVGAALGRRSS